MLLQIVNLVLQAGTEDLEGKRLPGFDTELEPVNVLNGFNPAADHAGQRDGIGLFGKIVIALFLDDRVIDHQELADTGDAKRRGQAKVADAEGRVGGDSHIELHGAHGWWCRPSLRGRRRHNFRSDAGPVDQDLVRAVEVHLPLDRHLRGRAALHRDGRGVGDHGVGGLRGHGTCRDDDTSHNRQRSHRHTPSFSGGSQNRHGSRRLCEPPLNSAYFSNTGGGSVSPRAAFTTSSGRPSAFHTPSLPTGWPPMRHCPSAVSASLPDA
jgi:hypothetical protein